MADSAPLFPEIELSNRHIENLRIVTDRDALLSRMPKHGAVAEVGVATGEFSAKILAVVKPTVLHLVDKWADRRYGGFRRTVEERFRMEIELGQVKLHQGTSIDELTTFDDQYFDWVYIDTSHDYKTTAAELAVCKDKVKNGGVISGHDYVTGSWLRRRRYGVIEAVHDFCIKNNWEMIYLTHESHRHLSYALRQRIVR